MRLCRRFYGTPVSRRFDPNEDLEADKYVDENTGEVMASGQMRWLLKKVSPNTRDGTLITS
jgi:hypothetical protein